MASMSHQEFANWAALYVGTAMCCALATALTVLAIAVRLWREEAWRDLATLRGAALFLPKTWLRWQKLYLLSTPVTLGIICLFAASLSWR